MPQKSGLFKKEGDSKRQISPLAEKLRPESWQDFRGLENLEKNLISQLRGGRGRPPSLVLWGPPGSGKTTLAKLIGKSFDADFVEFSAVLGGVKEVRDIVARARESSRMTILLVDEIHRFSKSQQDAFLPHVENGTIVLIGATTENPSFYLTSALRSRVKIVVLPALSENALGEVLQGALAVLGLELDVQAAGIACSFAAGDARRLLNLLEALAESLPEDRTSRRVSADEVKAFLKDTRNMFYDRDGEEHYNMVSAFIKSMRGSNPDAALYWAFRMIESGEDPLFIIRRMLIFASEDIGNADPRALSLAVSTHQAFERLGMPEGRIPVAHCITYLASAPKSNRSYLAMQAALEAARRHARVAVPLHLRNAPTALMKELGYGAGYQYPHDSDAAWIPGVEYLPDVLRGEVFYEPSDRGFEIKIAEKLREIRRKV